MDDAWMNEALHQDRADLLALIRMRFNKNISQWEEAVSRVDDGDFLERMILVVANAPNYEAFEEEWKAGPSRFRIDQQPGYQSSQGTRKER